MNPDSDLKQAQMLGEIRLYLKDKVFDVVPRLGRTIAFKSSYLEHEVRPTMGYERFAVTTWLHSKTSTRLESFFNPEGSIFVGIPSYRDSLVVETVRIMLENANKPKRIFVHVFL